MSECARIYVHAAAAFVPALGIAPVERRALAADPDIDLHALAKRVLGQNLRQASHFVELAAMGARLCLDRLPRPPTPDMAVYLGTGLGEVRRMEALFRQVLPPGPGIAAPFDFINASANMAAFYVARLAGVSARNLTVTQGMYSFEGALRLALDDLGADDVPSALVGGVDENCFPRVDYVRRWSLGQHEIMGEGSAWLHLTKNARAAVAELMWVRQLFDVAPDVNAWAQQVRAVIAASESDALTLVGGCGCAQAEREALRVHVPAARWRSYIEYCGSYPTAAAFGIAASLEEGSSGLHVHVNRNAQGETILVGWRRIESD